MSKSNTFRPWWLRRLAPLVCALAAAATTALFAWTASPTHQLFWAHGVRAMANVFQGVLLCAVTDDRWVRYNAEVEKKSHGKESAGIFLPFCIPDAPFGLPLAYWKEPVGPNTSDATTVAGHVTMIALPLGWPALALVTISGIGFVRLWRHRHHLPGHCPRCGYDRTGIEGAAPCPECGKPG